ncbi:Glycine cleavage T-protein family [Raphanus sativus]|nr:Glycine cleavage T-protein family [Raphanus sativus]
MEVCKRIYAQLCCVEKEPEQLVGEIISKLNLGDLIGQPYGTHKHYSFDGMPITVGVGSLISDEGFTMLMSPGGAVSVWKTLLSDGAVPMGSEAWVKLRVIQGRPATERELS